MANTTGIGRLDALLRPASVAVVGASTDAARIGGKLIRALRRGAFAGPIYPVNPRQAEIQGLRAYASIEEIPEVPDLAVIALPVAAVPAAVEGALARGARGVAILSAGFSEAGAEGREIEARLSARCREAGATLLGPNCLGVMNLHARLVCTFSTVLESVWPAAGPTSIVCQSGAFAGYCYGLAAERGLGIGKWVATGNEADVDVAQCIEWLVTDAETSLILAQFEGCADGRRMARALERAAAAGKAVVMLKAGATADGARAAASHTAALAGEDPIWDTVLRSTGTYRARSITEMIDVAYAVTRAPRPRGRSLGIVTGSGGFGVLLADAASEYGLELPAPPPSAQAAIRDLMPFASPGNPIDATGQLLNDIDTLPRIIAIALAEADYASLVVFLQHLPRAEAHFARFKGPLVEVRRRFPQRVLVLCGSFTPEGRNEMEAGGFLVFEEPHDAVRAIHALCHFAAPHRAGSGTLLPLPEPRPAVRPVTPGPLDEWHSRGLLEAAGIPFLAARLATTRDEAVALARAVGSPVALKIVSPDIPHKTELGGVALDLHDAAQVGEAWDRISARAAQQAPHARIRGMIVAPMSRGGVETVLGITRDPVFGPVVAFGLGGVDVEVFRDVALRPAPVDLATARAMIREIRGYPLLCGTRGRAAVDTEALAAAIVALSQFGAEQRTSVRSVDVNPFVALPQGGHALDAMVLQ